MSMAIPTEWSATPPNVPRHAPSLGENTREVLAEIGYSARELDALAASGAIGTQPPLADVKK